MIDARPEAHPFAPAVRGYNKEQVDAFIADLQSQLEAARRSANGGNSLANVGEEAAAFSTEPSHTSGLRGALPEASTAYAPERSEGIGFMRGRGLY